MPTLDFKGKNHIYAHHLTVPYRPLQLDESRSVLPHPPQSPHQDGGKLEESEPVALTDQNLIIHGDNLEALKALLPHYAGRVKCIYIDPPYNTGNEGWVYNDNVNSPMMQDWFEKQSPVDGEDLERHDKWLCMMWPRLHLLHELLSDVGVIFISLDDNEMQHLRMAMDEVFGEQNFIANIVWQHRYGRSNNAKLFSNQREYVVLYRKSDAVSHIRVKRDDKLNETYTNPDNDPRGRWVSSSYVNPATREQRPNLVYPIMNPYTGVEVNHPTHAWKYSRSTYEVHEHEGRLWWGQDGDFIYPRLKNFLSESEAKGIVPIDLMLADVAGTTDEGTRQLQDIFQSKAIAFNNPKPTKLISRLIEVADGVSKEDDAIILDSFAGSGTTAHAVLALNKEDGGNRRFILVECEDYADSITAERVRRVIRGVPNAKDKQLKEGLGGSFAYCALGEAIDVESLLEGGALPSFSELASYLLHTATGISVSSGSLAASGIDGCFYSEGERDFYLIYEPSLEFLRSNEAALNLERAKRIRDKGRSAIVFAAADFIGNRQLSQWGITFCQLPYELGFGG